MVSFGKQSERGAEMGRLAGPHGEGNISRAAVWSGWLGRGKQGQSQPKVVFASSPNHFKFPLSVCLNRFEPVEYNPLLPMSLLCESRWLVPPSCY